MAATPKIEYILGCIPAAQENVNEAGNHENLLFMIVFEGDVQPVLVPEGQMAQNYLIQLINWLEDRLHFTKNVEIPREIRDLEDSMVPVAIWGAAPYRHSFIYLVEIQGQEEKIFITSAMAKEKCPHLLLQFLKSKSLLPY